MCFSLLQALEELWGDFTSFDLTSQDRSRDVTGVACVVSPVFAIFGESASLGCEPFQPGAWESELCRIAGGLSQHLLPCRPPRASFLVLGFFDGGFLAGDAWTQDLPVVAGNFYR